MSGYIRNSGGTVTYLRERGNGTVETVTTAEPKPIPASAVRWDNANQRWMAYRENPRTGRKTNKWFRSKAAAERYAAGT